MIDIAQFDFPDIASFIPLIGNIAVGGFLLLLLLFSFQAVQQVRLLNIFLHTDMARVWLGLSVALLVLVILTGLWFVFA